MEIVANSDVVVAGPFLENKLDRARPWLGSENQEYHFISDRYGPADFTGPDGIEISIEKDGKVTLNGWAPSEDLMQLRHLGTEEPA
jgi:anaerobic ribonucleoside-triphosphate reductase activating protein